MTSNEEKERALSRLQVDITHLSNLFKECYLKNGKGSLLLYTYSIEEGHRPSQADYRSKHEVLGLFDDPNSKSRLSELIKRYKPNSEGILVLITNTNATWFITVNLKNHGKKAHRLNHT